MDAKINLLLVDDEQTLADIIADTLNEKGFRVRVAYDGQEALRKFMAETPDAVVTDIMMPCMDGFTFVEHLRKHDKHVPILLLSALSGAEDVVHGFSSGANDYIRKPFAISELIVRIEALLGRLRTSPATGQTLFEIGSFLFDAQKGILTQGKKHNVMSGREADVLAYLCRNMGEVVSSRRLLLDLWGDDSFFNARSLHVFISKLRRYLSPDPAVEIVNIRGTGYKLVVRRTA